MIISIISRVTDENRWGKKNIIEQRPEATSRRHLAAYRKPSLFHLDPFTSLCATTLYTGSFSVCRSQTVSRGTRVQTRYYLRSAGTQFVTRRAFVTPVGLQRLVAVPDDVPGPSRQHEALGFSRLWPTISAVRARVMSYVAVACVYPRSESSSDTIRLAFFFPYYHLCFFIFIDRSPTLVITYIYLLSRLRYLWSFTLTLIDNFIFIQGIFWLSYARIFFFFFVFQSENKRTICWRKSCFISRHPVECETLDVRPIRQTLPTALNAAACPGGIGICRLSNTFASAI